MIHSPASEWILTGISKDKDRLVFTLNRVVDRHYNNSLKRWHSSIYIVQTRINKGKEEVRIVQYPSPKVVITYTLDKAKRNRQLLRCSFAFISYIEGKRYKEVLKAIKDYMLIDRKFVLIQLCNVYSFPYSRLSLITRCLKVGIEFKALLILFLLKYYKLVLE